ncbi:putative secreted protein [Corynebacterium deserti GIMN1.010]|uniref:Putative secreted protein n=1 Tax=Corynebacterium deserti GIMN1.010 TaxID=931089 RepID=A0A0M5IUD1_9CORY|nr:hypothetical protein [Corynebacterium deserti]ALC06056.1 putative secreted protein [Corynebacterium deserti GIMN1.010]
MKLFSRTSLIALGTAAALTAGTLSAPAQAEEQATTPAQIVYVADEDDTSTSSADYETISDYILLITGIVGILSAGLGLAVAFQNATK